MERTVARWRIDHDPDATRLCYARIPLGTDCTCNQCRNFDAAAGRTFPAEFVSLLDALGVDPAKPAELCHWCREPSGLYLTAGWFHLVGSITAGEDVLQEADGIRTYDFEQLVPGLELGFSDQVVLARECFAELPLVQLEFQTRVPWVLDEPVPEI